MLEMSLQPPLFSFAAALRPGDHHRRPHQVGHRPLSSRPGGLALDEAEAGHSGWYLDNRPVHQDNYYNLGIRSLAGSPSTSLYQVPRV